MKKAFAKPLACAGMIEKTAASRPHPAAGETGLVNTHLDNGNASRGRTS